MKGIEARAASKTFRNIPQQNETLLFSLNQRYPPPFGLHLGFSMAGSSSQLGSLSEVDINGLPNKLTKGTGDNKPPSSVHTVLSNDDLLIEILLRLPVISLHLFKSVSKHWLSIITSPTFTLSRQLSNVDPPCGLLIMRVNTEMLRLEYDFESFDIRIPSKRSTLFTLGSEVPPGYVNILQSCNGLLLCLIEPDKYYVYNPTIKLFKMIPIKSDNRGVKLAYDPTKSPHYEVIHARFFRDNTFAIGYCFQIETYSSETGNLRVCGDRFADHCFSHFDDGIYWKDAIHWLTTGFGQSLHCKFEIVNEHPVSIKKQLPLTFDGKFYSKSKLFESCGCLLLLCTDYRDSRHLNIFEMRNDNSEWSVKYIVNLDDIMMTFPGMWNIGHHVWSIVLGEREEDCFMIIDLLSKVVQYNPVLKTVRTLGGLEPVGFVIGHNFNGFQFFASFAGV